MKHSQDHIFLFLVVASLLLQACSPLGLATGAGATVGMAAAQEGGISTAYTDTKIRAQINELWFRHDVEMFRKVDMTINQGRVLLTGVVQNPEHRVEAVRLAWQPKDVKQVINEITVAESDGITGFARDKWISTRLRTAITFDRNIQSINYSIDTVQGTVYLMGVAQSQAELNRVIGTARTIPDVRRVVSYVKLLGQKVSGADTVSADTPAGNAYVPEQSQFGHESAGGYDSGAYPPPGNSSTIAIQPVESEQLLDADLTDRSQAR
jgi:osmotically-inducible protein OsmY